MITNLFHLLVGLKIYILVNAKFWLLKWDQNDYWLTEKFTISLFPIIKISTSTRGWASDCTRIKLLTASIHSHAKLMGTSWSPNTIRSSGDNINTTKSGVSPHVFIPLSFPGFFSLTCFVDSLEFGGDNKNSIGIEETTAWPFYTLYEWPRDSEAVEQLSPLLGWCNPAPWGLLQPQTSNLVPGITLLFGRGKCLGVVGVSSVRSVGSSLLVSWWLIQMQTSPGCKQKRIQTPRAADTHREELRCHSVAPAGVCAQSRRPLIKEWFIGAGRRGPLSNSSSEWDFSSGRGRVNQTLGRGVGKARR